MTSNFKWPLINDNVTLEDRKVLSDFILQPDSRLTQGPKVREFEEAWSDWLGVKHSVFVNSGASANYIMASVLRSQQGKGGQVIVPAIGWVSDVAPLVNLGFTPVFVDVDQKTMSASLESIERMCTIDTKAIIVVHALGFNALSDEMIEFADYHNIMLIEDCCEAHGARFGDKKVGTIGQMSNFSFYFGHHMTTIEGGMVCTDDDEIYQLARMYRSHGMTREASESIRERYAADYPDLNPLFTFAVPGYNVRSTELNAVVGLNQLQRLDSNIASRCRNLDLWLANLDSSLYVTDFNVEGSSNFALPLILQEQNVSLFDSVKKVLEEEQVEFRIGTAGGGSQERQPYLEMCSIYLADGLNNANHIHEFGLYVGNHTDLQERQIFALCERLNRA